MKLGNLIELITRYTGIKYLVETYHALKELSVTVIKEKML